LSSPITTDEAARTAVAAADSEAVPQGPVVIEATGIEKTFRIPTHRIDSFKERAVHPFSRAEYRELEALKGISFEIHKGEFFGIVGRNGSGKSTLLKILASIYRADAGKIRMAGRLAPFIELGVGFDPELTARENVTLNGVMMGLPRGEAEQRLDAVLEFAELEEFVDLKLKNYSSGMMVRLAPPSSRSARTCSTRCGTRGRRSSSSRTRWRSCRASATGRCCFTTATSSTSETRRRPRAATSGSTSRRCGVYPWGTT
jgi:ABC-type glutathione transport system ATPase component